VLIHASAATAALPAGTVVSSTKGWYDAGDYNCYVVNSDISMHNLLSAYEHFPAYYDTLSLNIPESNNAIPDLLNEAKWNLDWMLTMQDHNDGGVYHKKNKFKFLRSGDACG
jgi:endoglucanase